MRGRCILLDSRCGSPKHPFLAVGGGSKPEALSEQGWKGRDARPEKAGPEREACSGEIDSSPVASTTSLPLKMFLVATFPAQSFVDSATEPGLTALT